MTAIDSMDLAAGFATICVILDSEGDVPEVPPNGAVGASSGGLILLSSRPNHRPRIVIDTEPEHLASTPWADSIPLFQQLMHIAGPTIRIHDPSFIADVIFDWTETGFKQVRVYRTVDTVRNGADSFDILETVGVEQWLITLADPYAS